MNAAVFNVIGEPTRLNILNALQEQDMSVGELVTRLESTQPAISKHLRILREAGLVTCHADAQRRIYRLDDKPLRDLDAWLEPYRQRWTKSLDALEQFLEAESSSNKSNKKAK